MTHYAVVGAGLTGVLASIRLAERGGNVDLFERRPDLRVDDVDSGRSINLALSTRGLDALHRVGLSEHIDEQSVPMKGRMIHAIDGSLTFQPYSTNPDHYLRSISRDALTIMLLDRAEQTDRLRMHFGQRIRTIDVEKVELEIRTSETSTERMKPDVIVGTDGAYSVVRSRMQRRGLFDYSQSFLEHGYKELTIPASDDGGFRIDANSLHIWPRGNYMMIALPNLDGSFTCTLFWPFEGPVGFTSVETEEQLLKVFRERFADALPIMPTLVEDYLQNPASSLVTMRCGPWNRDGEMILLGDAAHAVVPFYGQGANAALEDVTLLCDELDEAGGDHAAAFGSFYESRKIDTDTLADLAVSHYEEMRDTVSSPLFQLRTKLGQLLHRLAPKFFTPEYEMVTFSRLRYSAAVERTESQHHWTLVVLAVIVTLLIAAVVLSVLAIVR